MNSTENSLGSKPGNTAEKTGNTAAKTEGACHEPEKPAAMPEGEGVKREGAARCVFCGYLSVYSALLAKSRPVYRVLLDKERLGKVRRSKYHAEDKRRYALLRRLCAERGVPVRLIAFGENEVLRGSECGGIAAETGERNYLREEELLSLKKPFLAVLDGVEDPYNFGQMLRSFYAAGVDGVVVPKRGFFASDAIAARASAGASELLRLCAVDDPAYFCETAAGRGIFLCATAARKDALDLYSMEFSRPLCVVFGGEKRGISKKILGICDTVLRIGYPRNSGISLSASSAAAVIAFEIGRRLT